MHLEHITKILNLNGENGKRESKLQLMNHFPLEI